MKVKLIEITKIERKNAETEEKSGQPLVGFLSLLSLVCLFELVKNKVEYLN
jgi:hypothetical protein